MLPGHSGSQMFLFSATRTPFYIRFLSDNYEFIADAMSEAKGQDRGFRLTYLQDSTNCPP